MIRRVVMAAALIVGLTAPALAQAAGDHAVRDKLNELITHLRAERYHETAEGIAAVKKQVEDTRDFSLLEVLYDLMSLSATKTGNKVMQVRGEFQNAILRARAYGPLKAETIQSEVALAITYDNRRFDRPLQIVASNALGSIRMLKQRGQGSDDLDQQEAWAHLMIGQSYRRAERPEMALHHYRLAKPLGEAGALDDEEKGTLTAAMALLESQVVHERMEVQPGRCAPGPDASRAQGDSCLKRADMARLDGDSALAERILREMIGDAEPGRLTPERLPAALALHLMLTQHLAPDDEQLIRSVELIGHRLALDEHASAALLAMRSVAARFLDGRFDAALTDLSGHIARRAARGGNEDLAIRFLDIQVSMLTRGYEQAGTEADKLDRRIERTLVLLDAASFAELNGYDGLARRYREAAEPSIKVLAALPFDEMQDKLSTYWDIKRGFVFPGPGAAAELAGRIAMGELSGLGRGLAVLVWISSETVYRGADKRAAALADSFIADLRDKPEHVVLLSDILAVRASFADDPLISSRMNREAYDLLRDRPQTENKRVGLLLNLAADTRILGEFETALKLVDDARQIAGDKPIVDVKYRAMFESWRAIAALREDDLPRAIEARESALRIVTEATREGHFQRVEPTKALAELYARAGRIEEARALYRRNALTEASNPLNTGEAHALATRYSLVNLEAYYGPTEDTLKEIEKLTRLSGEAAARDESLHRSLIRAETFARYGLGQGLPALRAGRKALEMRRDFSTEQARIQDDRVLLEVMVGAAIRAAGQGAVTSQPR